MNKIIYVPEVSMRQFRCTRPEVYSRGTPGHKDRSARQGHYIFAETPEEAIAIMKERFPEENSFDLQDWR